MQKNSLVDFLFKGLPFYNETYQDYFENRNADDFPEIALKKKGKDKYTISALTIVANTLLNLDEFIVKG